MSGAVRLSAVRAVSDELFVHSGGIRTVTQGALQLVVYFHVVVHQLKYNSVSLAVQETARYSMMCPYELRPFGTNPL